MPKKFELPCASEFEEQCMLVQYLELKGLKFSKLAQDTYTPSRMIKMKNWASGVRKGVPDMMIVIPGENQYNYGEGMIQKGFSTLVFIEMKKEKGGKISEEQSGWLTTLHNCLGVHAQVCHGFEEAKKLINSLLK